MLIQLKAVVLPESEFEKANPDTARVVRQVFMLTVDGEEHTLEEWVYLFQDAQEQAGQAAYLLKMLNHKVRALRDIEAWLHSKTKKPLAVGTYREWAWRIAKEALEEGDE